MSKLVVLINNSRRTLNDISYPPYFDGCGFADALVEAIKEEIDKVEHLAINKIEGCKYEIDSAYSRLKEGK